MHSNPLKLHPLSAMLLCIFTTGATWAQALETPTAKNNSTSNAVATLTPIQAEYRNPETTEGSQSYTPTATRAGTGLSLSLRETPQSVSVVTRQRIEDQNMLSVKDVIANSPGLSIQNNDTERFSYNARGFSLTNYLYDGIPVGFSSGYSAGEWASDPIIYDRVEITRGATGLLTGAGNPSAAINLIHKRADSKTFTADLSLAAGSWNTYRATADLSTPITKDGRIRGRIIAAQQDNKSYLDRYHSSKSVLFATVEADISDNTNLRLGFNYQDNAPKGSTWGGFPLWFSDGSRTDWDRNLSVGTDWSKWASTTRSAFIALDHMLTNGWQINTLLRYSKNKADQKLFFLENSVVNKHTGLGLQPYAAIFTGYHTQNSADIKISGPITAFGREHELIFGLSHNQQKRKYYETRGTKYAPIGNFFEWDGSYPEPDWGRPEISTDTKHIQTGFYLATRLNLTDSLKVIIGGRYSKWKGREKLIDYPFDFSKSAFTPYAGILYDLNDNLTLYTSYTNIFKPQESRDRNGRWLDPLEGHNYEVGIKGSFLDGRLNASAALFQTDQDNLAQTDTGYFVPGTSFEAEYPAKGTRSRGYDLEISGEPLEGWSLMAGLSHWTAKDNKGNALQTNQPRTLFRLFTTYKLKGSLDGLTIGGGINWQSKNFTMLKKGPNGPERVQQGSYALVDLMARYQFNQQLSLQVNLNNVFNKKYYSQIGFYSQGAWGAPRNVMATLSYKY